MKISTGCDLEAVERFVTLLENEHFCSRVFTDEERAHIAKSGHSAQSAAGIYCAKEAISKALGRGLFGLLPKELGLVWCESGAPQVKLTGSAQEQYGHLQLSVSISHTRSWRWQPALPWRNRQKYRHISSLEEMICVKLWKLFTIPLLLVGLLGCKQEKVTQEKIAEHYQEPSFCAEYTVVTHSGFYTEYRLSCTVQNHVSSVTILQPESVAGITATVQGNQAQLQYEDLSLDALLPEIPGYAPMDMLHQLLMDLQTPPAFSGREQGRVTLEYRSTAPDGAELLKILVLNEETLEIQSAECYLDGSLILSLKMETIQWL